MERDKQEELVAGGRGGGEAGGLFMFFIKEKKGGSGALLTAFASGVPSLTLPSIRTSESCASAFISLCVCGGGYGG